MEKSKLKKFGKSINITQTYESGFQLIWELLLNFLTFKIDTQQLKNSLALFF
jgi:hypothetical protein